MYRNRRIGNGNKRPQRIPPALLYALLAMTAFGAVYAAALLYSVTVSDTLLILDKPTPRTSVRDALDPQADANNNNKITSENLGASDTAGPSTATTDDLALSDSAQAISTVFHQVSVTTTLGMLESPSSGISQSDKVDIRDGKSLSSSAKEALSLLDSVGRVFLIDVTDVLQIFEGTNATEESEEIAVDDDEDTRRDRGGPRRIVYDQSYFESRPLSRMQISDLDITDQQGRVVSQLRDGMDVIISVTARNYQNIDQEYAMFVQITDDNDIAVSIIQVTGSIGDGEQAIIEGAWEARSGAHTASAFLCDGTAHPAVISEIFVKELRVG